MTLEQTKRLLIGVLLGYFPNKEALDSIDEETIEKINKSIDTPSVSPGEDVSPSEESETIDVEEAVNSIIEELNSVEEET